MTSHTPVRVRIAPSPTGDPHVGTAYIALFNYVFARKHGGRFILRIEDTDRTRSTLESEAAILRALKWLGLTWDEGPDIGGPHAPYRQSERSALYRDEAERLVREGSAYRCFCTAARLEELRKAQEQAKAAFVGYDGHCRSLAREEAARRAASGEPSVIRLAVPRPGETLFRDQLRGEVRIDHAQVDDQVLLKTDGFPTYHLANVVDDHHMGITHVIRAEEWITSTPKHVLLYRAFGWQAPEFVHLPLLRNADKSKISKRKNPVSLDYYRDAGIFPEALLNYLGTMGFSIAADREKFTLSEMSKAFSWERVSLGGPVFDLVKLSALNGQYLRELSDADLLQRLRDWRLSDAHLRRLIPLARERVQRLDEFLPLTGFFFSGDLDYADVQRDLIPSDKQGQPLYSREQVASMLLAYAEAMDTQRDFSPAALELHARAFATEQGWKTRDLFSVLRLAATGRKAAPPLFDTFACLGRELVRRRLRQCAASLEAQPT